MPANSNAGRVLRPSHGVPHLNLRYFDVLGVLGGEAEKDGIMAKGVVTICRTTYLESLGGKAKEDGVMAKGVV
jgi:hypothetical protein